MEQRNSVIYTSEIRRPRKKWEDFMKEGKSFIISEHQVLADK
ncbi:hypothetical protein [Clostridium sp.]